MIRVVCTCGRAFKTEDRHAGKRTKCPECGADLTIDPAPPSSPGGGGAEAVPAWWYPSDPTDPAARATAPTRSGSDPGPDAVNTMVLPPGYAPQPKPPASSRSTDAIASNTAQGRPPMAPGGVHPWAPARPSFPAGRRFWAISIGTTALLVLAVGAILWLRPANPDVNESVRAPRGTVLNKPDDPGQGKVSPPSVPGRNPNLLGETDRRHVDGRCRGRHFAIGSEGRCGRAAQSRRRCWDPATAIAGPGLYLSER